MSQTIRIRRGEKADLLTYGPLAMAELGFCTDTGEVFVGNGAGNMLVGRAMSGTLANRPAAATNGRLYYVTSGENAGYVYFDDGSAWRRVNTQFLTDLTGTLDDILDGSAFKRILAQDVTDGHVNKISDGASTKTAAEIAGHIDDPDVHRKINDGGNTGTDLWSAQKIKTEIFNAVKGMDWQDSVKSRSVAIPPSSPVLNDRYLIPSGAQGDWAGKAGSIAHWNGSAWDCLIPSTGWAVYVEEESKNYTFNSSSVWVMTGGANQTIQAGPGLMGGGSGDIVTLQVGAGAGVNITGSTVSVKAYNGIAVDSNGIAVMVDDSSIAYDSANGNRLTVVNIDGGTF